MDSMGKVSQRVYKRRGGLRMTEEMFDIVTESSGKGLAVILHRTDFLYLVQAICCRLDSDRPTKVSVGDGIRTIEVKIADRVLAQAQIIPLDYIPIDTRSHDTSGEMYDFAIAFCEYQYGVADGTIDGSNWGHKECMKNSNDFDVNLLRYLQYERELW